MPRQLKKQKSLFDHRRETQPADTGTPLAARMRPRSLQEFVGQEHLVGPGRVLRRSIEGGHVPSMILWGPPGAGKTTLARLLAGSTDHAFEQVSAVTSGVAELRKVVQEARDRLSDTGQRTILFIDEIHRFNKAQQDAILPHVEEGIITLIGATTDNPSFEVIGPLLSRSRVYTLHALTDDQVGELVDRALADAERGLSGVELAADAREYLIRMAGGDARAALNTLELAASAADKSFPEPVEGTTGASLRQGSGQALGSASVTLKDLEDALQQRAYRYDKAGDAHYDTISAFIKSIRGSDPDAVLYWLARMVEAGEDPLFIVRRMVIAAAEDIGLADPQALVVATACQQAVHFIGMPEGFLPMAECAVYLATAPKSNSAYMAYLKAVEDVHEHGDLAIPLHLRNAPTWLMKRMGYGKGYQYAHNFEDHYVEQSHLPTELGGKRYYEAGDLGYEAKIKAWLAHLRTKPSTNTTN